MPIVEGLGNCPLCDMKIEVGSPAKYFQGSGHQAMAHTNCIIAHEARINTIEYKRGQARAKVEAAKANLELATVRLKNAQEQLKALQDV